MRPPQAANFMPRCHIQLTRTDTNLYASNTRTIVKKKRKMVIAREAFFTKVQTGRPFLLPFTPSSSGDPMVVVGGREGRGLMALAQDRSAAAIFEEVEVEVEVNCQVSFHPSLCEPSTLHPHVA